MAKRLFLTISEGKTPAEDEIWVVEGEKCADAFGQLGVLATTSPGGSSGATHADWTPLAGRRITIWPDNDKPGKEYAVNVFNRLLETGDSAPDINIVNVDELGLREKGDVVDWIEKGNGRKDILSIPRQPARSISDPGAVVIYPAEIWKAVDQAESMLLQKAPFAIFEHCGALARVSRTNLKKVQAGEEHAITLHEVSSVYFLDLLNRNMTFVTVTQKEGYKAVDPPAKIASRFLSRTGHWKLHSLTGLIYAPTLRPDGTVLEIPGYDKISGIFYDNAGTKFRPLKKEPSRTLAIQALERLWNPLQDFPFLYDEDKSVVLAAILTALVRQSLKTAPLFGFTAPTAGSGKTLLANVVSIIATGQTAVTAPQGADREEERKHLFATLLQGKPIVLIDNVDRPLSSAVLCNILTAPGMYKDRILGRSKMVEVPTNVTFLVTGNNLSFHGDMTRRALLCTIDPKMENPEARDNFRIKKLENHVKKYRECYVRAGLTILKAYINAGKPKQDIPQYGGFEEWSDWVRSGLVWIGCADPNLTRKRIEMNDPAKENFGRIVALWRSIFGVDTPVKVAEIVCRCNEALERKDSDSKEYDLATVLLEAARCRGKTLDGESIGKWLRRNKDKIQDGYKILKDPQSSKNQARWILTRA